MRQFKYITIRVLFVLFCSALGESVNAYVGDTNKNYISESIYLDSNGNDSVTTVRYFDDLGRPVQTVAGGVNPNNIYVYSLTQYNSQGQVSQTWSPIPDSQTRRYLESDDYASKSSSKFSDSKGYQEFEYDALERIISTTRPGQAWTDKPIVTSYKSNAVGEVKRYNAVISGNKLVQNGYYEAGKLLCTTTIDEEKKTVRQYTDTQGNVILERIGSSSPFMDTYFVYNDLGQLRFVLSPKYQDSNNLTLFAYEYKYDARGRVQEKRIPGSEPIKYWYDNADRIVCMQDGELRNKGLFRRFFFDKLGRPVIQCLSKKAPTYSDSFYLTVTIGNSNGMGNLLKEYGYGFIPNNQTNLTSIVTDVTTYLSSVELVNYYDSYDFLNLYAIPSSIRDSLDIVLAPQSVGKICGKPSDLLAGIVQPNINGDNLIQCHQYDAKGRLIRTTFMGIDNQFNIGRIEYNFTGDIKKEVDSNYRLSNKGSLESILTSIKINDFYTHTRLLHNSTLTLIDASGKKYKDEKIIKYDSLGNVSELERPNATKANMKYTYDLLHGWVKSISSTCGFQQTLFRENNAKNPLFNGSISAMSWYDRSYKYDRTYNYTYDGANRLTEAIYSESLHKEQQYSSGTQGPKLEGLRNDSGTSALDLIPTTDLDFTLAEAGNQRQSISAASSSITATIIPTGTANKYNEKITYDKNSNITSLQRRGLLDTKKFGLIDNLSFVYKGNQRTSIKDAAGNLSYEASSDFVDGANSTTEYTYNSNGALTKDLNRGISAITYDNLCNPKTISIKKNGLPNVIYYTYSADGTKLRTIYRSQLTSSITKYDTVNYLGNLIIKNRKPSMYKFNGGYATFNSKGEIDGWYYYIQDYMGNNRMVVRDSIVEQVTHYYPYGGVIGDISTNENVQKYKFEGKELDRTFGLDNYDIHARQYFAMAPTWDRIDPLAETYYGISPYSYCGGDPVNFGDYDGMNWYKNDRGNTLWRAGCEAVIELDGEYYYDCGANMVHYDNYSCAIYYQDKVIAFGEGDGNGHYSFSKDSDNQSYQEDKSNEDLFNVSKMMDIALNSLGGVPKGWGSFKNNKPHNRPVTNFMDSNLGIDGNVYLSKGKHKGKPHDHQLNYRIKPKKGRFILGKVSTLDKYAKIGKGVSKIGYIGTFIEFLASDSPREKCVILGGLIGSELGTPCGALAGTYFMPGPGSIGGGMIGGGVGYYAGSESAGWLYDRGEELFGY